MDEVECGKTASAAGRGGKDLDETLKDSASPISWWSRPLRWELISCHGVPLLPVELQGQRGHVGQGDVLEVKDISEVVLEALGDQK